MKRVLFSIFLGLFANCFLKAQLTAEWGYAFGNASGNSAVRGLKVDGNGDVVSIGYFTGTVDIDPGPGVTNLVSAGVRDIFIIKYTSSGSLVWGKRIGAAQEDFAFGLDIDASNNICVTGSFNGTVDFDPNAGVTNLNSGGTSNEGIFVLKLNSSGAFQWAHHFGGTNADRAWAIAADASGNIYSTGYFGNSVDFDPGAGSTILSSTSGNDIYVLKLTSAGNFAWVSHYAASGSNDVGYGIDVDASQNVYVIGNFTGSIDLDPGSGTLTYTAAGLSDVFVGKVDASGNYSGGFTIGSTAADEGHDIEVGLNEVYISGYFSGLADFDPSAGNSSTGHGGSQDVFVAKYDLGLSYSWATNIGAGSTENNYSIHLDNNNDLLVSGSFGSAVDFAPGGGVYTMNSISGAMTDGFILKLSSLGEFIYARSFFSYYNDLPFAITTDASNNVYMAGDLRGGADFDPSSATYNLTGSASTTSAYLVKYNSCSVLSVPDTIYGNINVCTGASEVYSIDPVPGASSYSWNISSGWSGSSTTNSITLIVGPSLTTYLSIYADNNCGSSNLVTTYLTANQTPSSLGGILGPDTVCVGDTNSFSTMFSGSATSFVWQFPAGWSSNPVGIGLTNNAVAGSSGNVILYGQNICGTTPSETLFVTVRNLPTLTATDADICEGSAAILEATASAGNVYWHSDVSNSDTLATGVNYTTNVLFNDTSFFVSAFDGICSSTGDLEVQVNVHPNPDVTVSNGLNVLTANQNGALYQWLDCNNSFTPLASGNMQFYSIISNGNYAVQVNLAGCIDTSACILIDNVSIDEYTTSNVLLYPNPASDILNIYSGTKEIAGIELVDMLGKRIYYSKENIHQLDVTHFSPGIYHLIVLVGEKNNIFKVIIN